MKKMLSVLCFNGFGRKGRAFGLGYSFRGCLLSRPDSVCMPDEAECSISAHRRNHVPDRLRRVVLRPNPCRRLRL